MSKDSTVTKPVRSLLSVFENLVVVLKVLSTGAMGTEEAVNFQWASEYASDLSQALTNAFQRTGTVSFRERLFVIDLLFDESNFFLSAIEKTIFDFDAAGAQAHVSKEARELREAVRKLGDLLGGKKVQRDNVAKMADKERQEAVSKT